MAAAAPLQQKFRTAMDNDLNTSMAVTVLYDVLKAKTNGATKRYVLADFDRVLSLDLLENAARKKAEQKQTAPVSGGFQIVSESGETDAQVEALLQARYDAKKAKDFTEADRIRDDLKAITTSSFFWRSPACYAYFKKSALHSSIALTSFASVSSLMTFSVRIASGTSGYLVSTYSNSAFSNGKTCSTGISRRYFLVAA